MARLPIPGQDLGAWGTILNDFLGIAFNADGTIKLAGLQAALTPGGPIGIGTGSPQEALELGSDANNTRRLRLSTAADTDSAGTGELIRLVSLNDAAKTAIAFFPDPASAFSKVWVQAHHYLHKYNPLLFTVSDLALNTLSIPTHNYITGLAVVFTTTGTLPAPLALVTTYYLRVSGGVTVHPTLVDAQNNTNPIDLTTNGTGVHTVTPDNTSVNNLHKHFSIEVTDSTTTAKQSRFSIPYDFDIAEIGFFSSNVNINDGKLRLVGSQGSFKELIFGNPNSNPLTPDGTNIRWSVRQDTTAEGGANAGSDFRIARYTDAGAAVDSPLFIKRSTGNVGIKSSNPTAQLELGDSTATTMQFRIIRAANTNTAGIVLTTNATDRWFLGMRNDSTDDYHIRDAANGRSLLRYSQSGYAAIGNGWRVPVPAAKTTAYTVAVTDYFLQGDATSGVFTFTLPAATGTGQVFVIKKIDSSANAITVSRAGTDTIEGATTVSLATQWKSVTLLDRATGSWAILAQT